MLENFICVVEQKPITDRKEWLRVRRGGIGASDIGEIFEAENNPDDKYSCIRAVMLSKLLELPEFSNSHIERGKFLEEPVSRLYAERSGRTVSKIGRAYIKEYPYFMANTDMVQFDRGRDARGILEIKCPSRHTYFKMLREGLPMRYIAQIQYQMLCYGAHWGTFAIYCADTHELTWFDIDRDDAIINKLEGKADGYWWAIQGIYNSNYARSEILLTTMGWCKKGSECEACNRIDPPAEVVRNDEKIQLSQEAENVLAEYNEYGEQVKAAEGMRTELKKKIVESLGSSKVGIGQKWKASYSSQSKESVSTKELRERFPDVADQIVRNSTYEVLRVTKIGE